jgi:hypothetical protein
MSELLSKCFHLNVGVAFAAARGATPASPLQVYEIGDAKRPPPTHRMQNQFGCYTVNLDL